VLGFDFLTSFYARVSLAREPYHSFQTVARQLAAQVYDQRQLAA
jgi:hypothetical protein